MSTFNLILDNIDVSSYVKDSLTELNQRSEGGSTWDYRLDTVSVTLDSSVIDLFDNLTEFNIDTLYRKLIKINYYDNNVLSGIVGEVAYNFENEEIDIEIYSYGKVIADIDLDDVTLKNFNVDGETLKVVIHNFLIRVNDWLKTNNYPFTIFNIIDSNPIDVKDFIFFKSLKSVLINAPSGVANTNPLGIYEHRLPNQEIGTGDYYIVYNSMLHLVGYKLNENGIDYTAKRKIISGTAWRLEYQIAEDWINEVGIEDYLRITYGKSDITYKGRAKIGSTYFCIANNRSLKITLEQEDKFVYEYENPRSGDFQKDFAIMTNSITWVGADRKMYYQSRGGRSGLLNPKQVISVTYDSSDQRGAKFEVPEDIFVADETRLKLDTYYADYFQGIFNRYIILIDRAEFEDSEYPLMLKNLQGNVKGTIVDFGIIRAINYGEDTLEFECERKIR